MAFIEQALAALAGTGLTGPEKLETIGLFSGAVRLLAQTEISQQRAGQDTAQWQGSLASYLLHDRGRRAAPAAGGRAGRAARCARPNRCSTAR